MRRSSCWYAPQLRCGFRSPLALPGRADGRRCHCLHPSIAIGCTVVSRIGKEFSNWRELHAGMREFLGEIRVPRTGAAGIGARRDGEPSAIQRSAFASFAPSMALRARPGHRYPQRPSSSGMQSNYYWGVGVTRGEAGSARNDGSATRIWGPPSAIFPVGAAVTGFRSARRSSRHSNPS